MINKQSVKPSMYHFPSFGNETMLINFTDTLNLFQSLKFKALFDFLWRNGLGFAFWGDLNARKNFIDFTETFINLLNLVSYTAKNVNWQDKGISIQTT